MPAPRPKIVYRLRLIKRLNDGVSRKLTLVSAAAGYGKTTLVSGWLADGGQSVAWLSLDEGDNDTSRFLAYLLAAIRTVEPRAGAGLDELLVSSQPPVEAIIPALLNELQGFSCRFVFVMDDYHVIDNDLIHKAIGMLIERMPPQMHIVIVTRQEPPLAVARLRVRNQLTEVRAADLQFTHAEAAEFLGEVMGLELTAAEVELLGARTEGWAAGLQLAALSLQGRSDAAGYIESFTGNHPFVLDYLLEEVLRLQPAHIQTFLLHTSILDRMCGPLCDVLLLTEASGAQETLEMLEQANLFLIPLDQERRWYRYHHLFADLLRQRLHRESGHAAILHKRASLWYEEHGYEIEAFQHAASGGDIERAAALIEGKGVPLLFRGAVTPVCNWLGKLPVEELDKRPQLWVLYASALMMIGRTSEVEAKLSAAERALQEVPRDEHVRDLIGHIATTRATLAVSRHQAETIMAEANLALQYLHPDNVPVRTAARWALAYAYMLQGDRVSAGQSYTEALATSRRIGHVIIAIMSTLGLAHIQEQENLLHTAADTYGEALKLAGNPPFPVACEAHLGLARIHYQWNDLEAAMRHGQQSIRLAGQLEYTDRAVAATLFMAQLKLAYGDEGEAAVLLAEADHAARQQQFAHQLPYIAEAQIGLLLRRGQLAEAARVASQSGLPLCQARVQLAQGETAAAMELLEETRRQAEARSHPELRLKAMVLQAIAGAAHGDKPAAIRTLEAALAAAESGGLIRIFMDEGEAMAGLLREAAARGLRSGHLERVLAAFAHPAADGAAVHEAKGGLAAAPLIEPLSERELQVLQLIADGLSNQDISKRLFLALSTVKGYNRTIFDKLQVKRRTEAVAYARRLGLIK